MEGIVSAMKKRTLNSYTFNESGFTVLEVVIALFIFGLVSSALFNLMGHSSRIRGRALYVENATRLAADESERLKNISAQNSVFEDSSYTVEHGGREYKVERTIINENPSQLPSRFEPVHISIRVSGALNEEEKPLTFNLLIGNDSP